jgi:hypothetical protein
MVQNLPTCGRKTEKNKEKSNRANEGVMQILTHNLYFLDMKYTDD